MKTITIQLPSFHGFYNSIWLNSENDWQEYYRDELGVTDFDDWKFDYEGYTNAVCEAYTGVFEDLLNDALGLNVKLEYGWIRSPKEYNFSTDKIICKIHIRNVRKFERRVRQLMRESWSNVAKRIIRNHTSRSGFISFMSNAAEDWYKTFMTDDMVMSYLLWYLVLEYADLYDGDVDHHVFEDIEVYEENYWAPATPEAKAVLEECYRKQEERAWDKAHWLELPLAFD